MYHIVPDALIWSSDLVCNNKVKMMNGIETQTRCTTIINRQRKEQSLTYQVGTGSPCFGDENADVVLSRFDAKIVSGDVQASDGILHAINRVILPLPVEP